MKNVYRIVSFKVHLEQLKVLYQQKFCKNDWRFKEIQQLEKDYTISHEAMLNRICFTWPLNIKQDINETY